MSGFITSPPSLVFGLNSNPPSTHSYEILDQEGWKNNFGFQVEGKIPPIPQELEKEIASLKGKKDTKNEDLKFSLLLMPKNLNFETFQKLVNDRSDQYDAELMFVWETMNQHPKAQPIEENYWVLIANSDIYGSKGVDFPQKLELINSEYGSGYGLPHFLEALVSLFFQKASSKEPVFDEDIWTYTLCSEVTAPYRYAIDCLPKEFSQTDKNLILLNVNGAEKDPKESGVAVYRTEEDLKESGVAVCRRFE